MQFLDEPGIVAIILSPLNPLTRSNAGKLGNLDSKERFLQTVGLTDQTFRKMLLAQNFPKSKKSLKRVCDNLNALLTAVDKNEDAVNVVPTCRGRHRAPFRTPVSGAQRIAVQRLRNPDHPWWQESRDFAPGWAKKRKIPLGKSFKFSIRLLAKLRREEFGFLLGLTYPQIQIIVAEELNLYRDARGSLLMNREIADSILTDFGGCYALYHWNTSNSPTPPVMTRSFLRIKFVHAVSNHNRASGFDVSAKLHKPMLNAVNTRVVRKQETFEIELYRHDWWTYDGNVHRKRDQNCLFFRFHANEAVDCIDLVLRPAGDDILAGKIMSITSLDGEPYTATAIAIRTLDERQRNADGTPENCTSRSELTRLARGGLAIYRTISGIEDPNHRELIEHYMTGSCHHHAMTEIELANESSN